ncbi:energy-coupling factor transporter transmembrane component T family protein [Clostridium lundense]|uniref:energy-coupling factor transporter transmembrane component T family protein n=1 Tax=Clostridium lundense TaxID=319475 RepID=UPI0004898957|nr:energy-coupling factor transporter transmembrane component T [Clostridium lundense]
MKALSLYEDKESFIHKVDPISKIFYIITMIAVTLIIPTKTSAAICMFASIVCLIIGKVFKKVIPIINFSLIILLSIIIIQGLFNSSNKTPLFNLGNVTFYKEGLMYALLICLRVINILSAFAILVLTTKPSDLIEALVRKGLSAKIGYVLSSVLQIIPQMTSTMETIMDAQRSRGMETEGKLSTRIKAFFPLIGPVVMNSLIATRERSMALEVRGFNASNKKSFLNDQKYGNFNTVIRIVLFAAIILSIIWRVVL